MDVKLYSKLQEGFEDIFQSPTKRELSTNKRRGFISTIKEQGAYKNEDGTWSCDGDLDISFLELTKIPVQFKEVMGLFNCRGNELTSLKGCPETTEEFDCSDNELTSLEGGPKEVYGDYICKNNELTSLKGSAEGVSGKFFCNNNLLTSLADGPKELLQGYNTPLSVHKEVPKGYYEYICFGNPVSEEELLATIGR